MAGGAQAQTRHRAALQIRFDGFQFGEKRLDEVKKFPARRAEGKGTALKKGDAEVFLQLGDLAAHRRLLDAIRHVAHRLRNAAMPGRVIKQFQMMNVHVVIGVADRFFKRKPVPQPLQKQASSNAAILAGRETKFSSAGASRRDACTPRPGVPTRCTKNFVPHPAESFVA